MLSYLVNIARIDVEVRCKDMFEICQCLASANSVDSLKLTLTSYFARERITSLAFTYYNQHTKTGNKLLYDWVTAPLQAWHQYYLNKNYADIDRTLGLSEQSIIPVYWDVHLQLIQAKNKREQRIRQESIDFGIDKGLCIPFYSPDGDFAILVLHQRINEDGLKHWQQKQYVWQIVTQHYFHYLRQSLLCESISNSQLTSREQQCLSLTTQGMRIEIIANMLEISPRAVNFHLQNANKKLGVNNKYLAVMRWLSKT